jgi:ABC-type multidrug transport system fused ATPase/permease subunit
MFKKTKLTLFLIFKIIQDKPRFIFWFFVRFISSLLPLFTIYLYSKTISSIENKIDFSSLFFLVLIILLVRLVDNFLRLRSLYKLDECISNISFNIHNFFTQDLRPETKVERHQSIQAIRNFADASSLTLMLFRQPGIDSIVSLITIPVIFWFVDARIFVLEIAYITVYMIVDYYTTQKYVKLKDTHNSKVEDYYAKLQESNDTELEQKTFTRHFTRLSNWNFIEWFILQNSAVFFYCLILGYSIIAVYSGYKQISDIVLIMGYVASTQAYLNSFSEIKDSLADMTVAVDHLAKNKSISVIDLDDLV